MFHRNSHRGFNGGAGWAASVLLAALLLICAAQARGQAAAEEAQTFYVDAAHVGPQDGGFVNPDATIQAALARTAPGRGDIVLVRDGAYLGPLTVPAGTALLSENGAAYTQIAGASALEDAVAALQDGALLRGFRVGETGGAAIAVTPGATAEVTNCIVYDSAIGIHAGAGAALFCINNTVFQNGTGVQGENDASFAALRNNIFFDNEVAVSAFSTGGQSGYNAFYGNRAAYEGAFVPGEKDFVSNPQFVEAASMNLHLRWHSNLRNAGDPDPAFNDPDGTRNDVGADGGPFGVRDTLAPQARIVTAPSPPAGNPPFAALLDARTSSDAWGVSSWEWDFDAMAGVDFHDASGASVPVLYQRAGGYLVSVRVTDHSGLQSEASVSVRVGAPPRITAAYASPAAGPLPLLTTFSVNAASLVGGSLSYEWDFDGDGAADSALPDPVHTFPQHAVPGLHRISLVVTDGTNTATQARVPVTITAYPVAASAAYTPGKAARLEISKAGSALDGTVVQVAATALNEPMTIALSDVAPSALPFLPTQNVSRVLDIAPAGQRLSQSIRVEIPLGVDGPIDPRDIAVHYWRSDTQSWAEDGIHGIRLSGDAAPKLSFSADMLGLFAITAPAAPVPAGPCFIATAAYGTPMAEEIAVLRRMRDRTLLESAFGSALVELYYRISPPVADMVARHPVLAAGIRVALWPVLAACRLAESVGMPFSAGILLLLVPAVLLCRARRVRD